MLIIFEGADGSGKSTIVKKLKNIYDWNTMVAERYDKNTFKDYYDAATSDGVTLCDRSPISDIVYRLCDNFARGPFDLYDIACILAKNVKIVYCENNDAFDNAMARGEKFITNRKHHERICKTYNTIIKLLEKFTEVPIYRYNWKTDEPVNVIKFIMKEANK